MRSPEQIDSAEMVGGIKEYYERLPTSLKHSSKPDNCDKQYIGGTVHYILR